VRRRTRVFLGRRIPRTADIERIKPRVERAVLGFGLVNPLFAFPQLYNIFVTKHADGLSPITVGSGLLMAVLWTAYGLLGRQTAIWSINMVWVVLNAVTLVGIARYT